VEPFEFKGLLTETGATGKRVKKKRHYARHVNVQTIGNSVGTQEMIKCKMEQNKVSQNKSPHDSQYPIAPEDDENGR